MKTTYTYTKTSNNNIGYNTFNPGSNANYSEVLDNLIAADMIDKNSYLFDYPSKKDYIYINDIIDCNKPKKSYDLYTKAINFISGYKKNNFPYILNKTYTLSDGTPIIFFEDSIQIGFDLYYFDDLTSPIFLKNIKPSLKKKIATIYTDGLKISIYK